MNLHGQIIQYANAMSGLQKAVRQVRTYKSGPTRDQYLVAHARTVPLRECVTLAGVVLGAYRSTAHAAKFSEVVERAIGIAPPLPDRLAAYLKRPKLSLPVSSKYDDFKQFLLKH